MTNISTLSKKWKSSEWKARKRAQHKANQELRASLHARMANGNMATRVEIQKEIDAISQRG